MPIFGRHARKIHLISYDFMGKHAFLMASFQCLARSLLVLEPTEYKTHPTILQVCGALHVCVLHSLIIQQRLSQSTEGVSLSWTPCSSAQQIIYHCPMIIHCLVITKFFVVIGILNSHWSVVCWLYICGVVDDEATFPGQVRDRSDQQNI